MFSQERLFAIQNRNHPKSLARDPSALKGDPLGIFNSSVAKHQKNKGGPLEEIKNFSKKSHNAKKLKGDLWGFSTCLL